MRPVLELLSLCREHTDKDKNFKFFLWFETQCCIDALIKSTFHDKEIIVVDSMNADILGSISDKYASISKKCANIRPYDPSTQNTIILVHCGENDFKDEGTMSVFKFIAYNRQYHGLSIIVTTRNQNFIPATIRRGAIKFDDFRCS